MSELSQEIQKFLYELVSDINLFKVLGPGRVCLKDHPNVLLRFTGDSKKPVTCLLQIEDFQMSGTLDDLKTIRSLKIILDDYLPFPSIENTVSQQLSDLLKSECFDHLPLKTVGSSNNICLISEHMYNYFASKCSKHEMYDAGYYGQSEKHAVAVKNVIPAGLLKRNAE